MDIIRVLKRYLDAAEEPSKTLLPIEGYEKEKLVSLETAVEKLKSWIPDLERKVWSAKSRSSEPKESLTVDESAAIHLYTIEWNDQDYSLYIQLNQTLRSENRDALKPWFSYLKLLLTALHKLPSFEGTIYRGIVGDDQNQSKNNRTWWGFSSCTDDLSVAKRFTGNTGVRTIFSIKCLDAKRIRNHSFYEEENEILLMPGTCLRVISQSKETGGLRIINMEQFCPEYPLIASPFDSSNRVILNFLNTNMQEEYRKEVAKNKSLFNLMNQAFKVEAEMTRDIRGSELDKLIMKTADTHLKRLYKDIRLVGDGRCYIRKDALNERHIYLAVYRRNPDCTYDLLVAYAIQTKDLNSTKLMGYGLSAICVGAAAGLLTLNPMIGVATGAAMAAATGTKGIQEYIKIMPDFIKGFLIDELVKRRFLKINADREVEF